MLIVRKTPAEESNSDVNRDQERVRALLALLAVSLLIADCGTGATSTGAVATPTPSSTPIAQMVYVLVLNASGATALVPINTASNQAAAPIPLPPGYRANALLVSSSLKKAFLALVKNGSNVGAILPIDLTTNTLEPMVPMAISSVIPQGMAFSPDGKTLYVTGSVAESNGAILTTAAGAAELMAMDLTSGAMRPLLGDAATTFPLGVAISPNGRTAYMISIYKQFIVGRTAGVVDPIDLTSVSLEAGYPTPINTYPTAIALTSDGSRAWLVARGTGSGAIVFPMDVTGPASSPMTQIDAPPGSTPVSIVVSPDGKMVYALLVANGAGSILPIELATAKPMNPITISAPPVDFTLAADGRMAYVTSRKPGSDGAATSGAYDLVWPIDLPSGKVLTPIVLGATPSLIAAPS